MKVLTFTDLVILSAIKHIKDTEGRDTTYRELLGIENFAGSPYSVNQWLLNEGVSVWYQTPIYTKDKINESLTRLREAGAVKDTAITHKGVQILDQFKDWREFPLEAPVNRHGIDLDAAVKHP